MEWEESEGSDRLPASAYFGSLLECEDPARTAGLAGKGRESLHASNQDSAWVRSLLVDLTTGSLKEFSIVDVLYSGNKRISCKVAPVKASKQLFENQNVELVAHLSCWWWESILPKLNLTELKMLQSRFQFIENIQAGKQLNEGCLGAIYLESPKIELDRDGGALLLTSRRFVLA
jgi:hypothetical protein